MTGERITVVETARDTDGELLGLEYLVPPRVPGPPLRVHPHQEERFVEVLAGILHAWLGAKKGASEKVKDPPSRRARFTPGAATARRRSACW